MLIIKRSILILGEGPTQGLDDTTITWEAKSSINFTALKIKDCLSLHYNGSSSLFYVNGVKIYKFKGKYSVIKSHSLCLGNVSKDFTVDIIKKPIIMLLIILLLILVILWIFKNFLWKRITYSNVQILKKDFKMYISKQWTMLI